MFKKQINKPAHPEPVKGHASVFTQFLIYSAGAILLRLITAGSVFATIKFIPPDQFGLLSLLNNLMIFLPIILGLGLRQVLAIEFFNTKNVWCLIWELVTIYLFFSIPVIFFLLLNLNFLNQLLFLNQINNNLLILAIITSLLNFFPEMLFQFLRFQNQALKLAAIQIMMGLILAGTTIYLLKFCNLGLASVIWAQFIAQFLITGYFLYLFIINKFPNYPKKLYKIVQSHQTAHPDPSSCTQDQRALLAWRSLGEARVEERDLRHKTVYGRPSQKSLSPGIVSVLRSHWRSRMYRRSSAKLNAKPGIYLQNSTKQIIGYLKIGLPFVPNILFAWLIMACNRWLLNWQLDLKDVGIYSLAENISLIFQALITQPMMHSFLPYAFKNFSQYPDQAGRLDRQYTCWAYYFIIFFVITIPLGFIIFRPILHYLLPSKYLIALSLITPLIIAQVIFASTYLTSASLQYRKKTHYLAILMATSALVAILLNLWLIPIYKTWGCVIATNCAYLCYFGLIQVLKYTL